MGLIGFVSSSQQRPLVETIAGCEAILDGTFSGNRAAYNGGGINNEGGGTIVEIANSRFSANTATYGGGLREAASVGQISRTTFVGNIATTAKRSGDAWVLNGQKVWISNGTFRKRAV